MIGQQELSFIQPFPAIKELEIQIIPKGANWTTPIVSYLKNKTLPKDCYESQRLRVRAARFVLVADVLYKRGFFQPYLSCLTPDEVDYVMREVHERVCGNHLGVWSLVHKLIWVGYYWPTMQKDAQSYMKTCVKCQCFSNVIRQPFEPLTSMNALWPFAQWGLDIMGPFPIAIQQLKFLVVGIDYFTKWVEAKPLETITEKNIRSFVWKSIIYQFGIFRALIFDNGNQFNNDAFRDFCNQLGIKNYYSSPAYPQANGQVKVTNRSLLKLIKNWLEGAKGIWSDKLLSVLWAYRTTAWTPIGETPFCLVFGSEAIILAEVGIISYRIAHYNERKNEKGICLHLDLLDEVRMTVEHEWLDTKTLWPSTITPRWSHETSTSGTLSWEK